jgi:hypothetical protein
MLMVAALVPAMRDRAAHAAAGGREGAPRPAPAGGGQVPGDVETGVTASSYC